MAPHKGRRVKNFVKSKISGGTGVTGEDSVLDEQLLALGLKDIQITGDGNCFFRAIADQMEGNEEEHEKYRTLAVDYLEEHKEDFEPFLEEEVAFDEYCSNMRQDGTWAGHMELQATSLATKCDICIHRAQFPRWQILNFQSAGTPILQLSYHGEEHYNSVRKMNDDGAGPPQLETIKVNTSVDNDLPPAKDGVNSGIAVAKESADVKLVVQGTGCPDLVHVVKVLNEVHGDTDAAIEYLIAEGNLSEYSDSSTDANSGEDSGALNDATSDLSQERRSETSGADSEKITSGSASEVGIRSSASRAKNAILHPAQAVSRNKRCPCGSKKKYKVCCGSVHAKRPLAVLNSSHEAGLSNKDRKELLKASKSSSPADSFSAFDTALKSSESDLGVLSI